jgi:hypothetical protein
MDGEYGSFQFLNTKVTAEKKSASRIPMKLTKKTMNYTHNLTLTCEWLLNQIPKRNAISILFYYSKAHAYLTQGASYTAVFEGPQKGPKFACLGREQNQNNGTWNIAACLAWGSGAGAERHNTSMAMGTGCKLHCSIGPLEKHRSSAGRTASLALRFSKACRGDVNGGPFVRAHVFRLRPGIRAAKHCQ